MIRPVLVVNLELAVLNALFDGEFEFAFGVVEFALLLDEFRLSLLGLGQLFVAGLNLTVLSIPNRCRY